MTNSENEEKLGIQATCPECHKLFKLAWHVYDLKDQTIRMRLCVSDGMDSLIIQCPHCNYEEEP